MTTLFKKLTLSSLSLVVASGIVFSVGSSEPSLFEGQAAAGTYTVVFDSTATFSGNTATKSSTPASYASKSIFFFGGNATLPMDFSTNTVTEIHNLSYKILNMNTISIKFTGVATTTVSFKEDGGNWLNATLASEQVYDFSTQSVAPEFFDFLPSSSMILESITITYSC